jgi:hypothetical protein
LHQQSSYNFPQLLASQQKFESRSTDLYKGSDNPHYGSIALPDSPRMLFLPLATVR